MCPFEPLLKVVFVLVQAYNPMFTTIVINYAQAIYAVPSYLYTAALIKTQKLFRISAPTFHCVSCTVTSWSFSLTSILFMLVPLYAQMSRTYVPYANSS